MGTWIVLAVAVLLMVYAAYELVVRPAAGRQGNQNAPRSLASSLASPSKVEMTIAVHATTLIAAMSALIVVCWVVLYHWYSLPGHYATPDFAFDKIPGHFDSPILRYTTALFFVVSLCYALIYWLMQRMPTIPRKMKVTIVLLVVGVAVINLFLYPVGALDVYNYIIELKLPFFYHQNPYVTTFQNHPTDPASTFAFFLNVPLFYGPLWLYISGLSTLITGFGDTQHVLLGLKALNIVLLLLTALAIYRYQADDKRGWSAAYLFVANPLVLFEFVGNAHNDVMMAMFLIVAVVALKGKSFWAAPLLMLSVLVKFFSASLFPLFALTMAMRGWSRRSLVVASLISLILLVVLPLPFFDGGKMITGLSTGTNIAQSLNSASLFSLTREYLRQGAITPGTEALIQKIFLGIFAVSVLAVMGTVWWGRALESGLADTFLLFAILVSLLTPWYVLPAWALLALRRNDIELSYLFVATTLGLVYYPLSVYAWFNSGWPAFQVHIFQGLLLAAPVLGLFLVELGRYALNMSRVSRHAIARKAAVGIETPSR